MSFSPPRGARHNLGDQERQSEAFTDEEDYTDEEGSFYDEEGEEEEEESFEEGSYEEGDDDDDEFGQEEDERLLKYDAWNNAALKNQSITAVCIGAKSVVVGTSLGALIMLDASGTCVINRDRALRSHDTGVRDICLDGDCEFVASVCEGGSLFIQNVNTADFYEHRFDRPMQTISLHPLYRMQDDRPFVCGGNDGRVLLSTKGFFFGNRSIAVLDERCGRVFCSRWFKNCIAWATERDAVVICNAQTKVTFFRHARLATALRAELFRCSMIWEDGNPMRLIIAWGNIIRIIKVWPPKLSEIGNHGRGEVEYGYDTDRQNYTICGVAPFERKLLVLTTGSQDGWVNTIEMRVINRENDAETMCEEISVRSKRKGEQLQSPITQFMLTQTFSDVADDPTYFIVTPSINMVARRTDHDDKVQYMLQQGRFVQAFAHAQGHRAELKKTTAEQVGEDMLNDMFQKKRFSALASRLDEVIGGSPQRNMKWERWIGVFHRCEQTHDILPFIPDNTSGPDRAVVAPMYYELILHELLTHNVAQFQLCIFRFRALFDASTVCNDALERLKTLKLHKAQKKPVSDEELQVLGECIGHLWEFQGEYGQALRMLLDVKNNNELFQLVSRHHLYADAAAILDDLFAKNAERTLQLLVEQPDDEMGPLSPEAVVNRLENKRDRLWSYLVKLQSNNGQHRIKFDIVVRKFAFLVTTLFIDYDPAKLLNFLKCHAMSLNNARTLELCQKRGCIEETVFVMAKMGDREKGLSLLIKELKNVPKAIGFIQDHFSEEEQEELFKKLVDLVLETEDGLQGQKGHRWFAHAVSDRDSWGSIADKYNVPIEKLCGFNGNANDRSAMPLSSVRVPVNLLEALLTAISNPKATQSMDPIYLIRHIPPHTPIPNLAQNLQRISTSKRNHQQLMKTIIKVLHGDICDVHQRQVTKMRRCVRVDPQPQLCEHCDRPLTIDAVATFRCGHSYHARCAAEALRDRGAIVGDVDPSGVFADRSAARTGASRRFKMFPFCVKCPLPEEGGDV
jgi:hypothetical protein